MEAVGPVCPRPGPSPCISPGPSSPCPGANPCPRPCPASHGVELSDEGACCLLFDCDWFSPTPGGGTKVGGGANDNTGGLVVRAAGMITLVGMDDNPFGGGIDWSDILEVAGKMVVLSNGEGILSRLCPSIMSRFLAGSGDWNANDDGDGDMLTSK